MSAAERKAFAIKHGPRVRTEKTEKTEKWEKMDDSMWKELILRYKAEKDGLDLAIKGVEGLQSTLPKHRDLKSGSLIVLLSSMQRDMAPMREELRPVSDFYKEVATKEKKLESYVNGEAFRGERRACERVMVNLKKILSHTHTQLRLWHVQEFGKLTALVHTPKGVRDWSETWKLLERDYWEDYTTGYTALMTS